MRFAALTLLFLTFLASCGGPAEPVWAPDKAVRTYSHRADGPPEVTLFTVISTRNGTGAHSALLINGQDRILFDPAGSFSAPFAPERNDALFGMTDRAVTAYINYHVRDGFEVTAQRLRVTADQADQIARLAKAYGAVPKAQCSLSITRILTQVDGFQTIKVGYFPKKLSSDFGTLPGVERRVIKDHVAGSNMAKGL